jgi:hypothetical protein
VAQIHLPHKRMASPTGRSTPGPGPSRITPSCSRARRRYARGVLPGQAGEGYRGPA